MVRCPKCGKDSPDQARFCRACGQELTADAQSAAPTPTSPEERARRLLEDGFRFSEAGRLQQAIEACQQAISFNPASTSAHSLLGTLFERVGDREGAIRAYEQVLTLSPGSTVERRRLNELMGVPAAPEPVAVSPRAAQMALTGAIVVVVAVAAILYTSHQAPSTRREARGPGAAQLARRGETPGPTALSATAPPRFVNLGRAIPRMPARPRQLAAMPREQPRWQDYGFGQRVGPGSYLLPAAGGGQYASARPRARRQPVPPIHGAVLLPGSAAPTLPTPGWRYPSGLAEVGGGGSSRLARAYYMQKDYQRAIETYRGYLNESPQAGAAVREELAWVYAESGQPRRAAREYDTALSQYRTDLNRGHNVEAARHGVRTCESALKALESN